LSVPKRFLHRRVGQAGLVAKHLAKFFGQHGVELGTRAGAVSVRQAFQVVSEGFGKVVLRQTLHLRIAQTSGLCAQ
jgi:hypothetical protein